MGSKNSKILIIDDEYYGAINLIDLISIKHSDIQCDVAHSVTTAKEKIKNERFDLIICDNLMPDDGFGGGGRNAGINLYNYLRGQGNKIPFVLYTFSRIEEQYFELQKDRNFFYLPKGHGDIEIVMLIRKLLI